jgi:hypothetical protein
MPALTLGSLMLLGSKMIVNYEYASNCDVLTEAWSLRAFWMLAATEIACARRTQRPLSLTGKTMRSYRATPTKQRFLLVRIKDICEWFIPR